MSQIEQLAFAVTGAKRLVEQCRAALHSKQAEVRTSLTLAEVLFDRPDLLDLYRSLQDDSRLESEYAEQQARAQQEKRRLLDELRSSRLERAQAVGGDEFLRVKEERQYLHWLLREIQPGDDLTGLLGNPRLRQPHRKAITRARASRTPANALAYLKDLLYDEMRTACESYDRLTGYVSDAELEPLISLPLETFLKDVENARARLVAARAVKAELARAEELRSSREQSLLDLRTREERSKLRQAEAALEQAQAALHQAQQREAEERAQQEQEARRRAQEERERLEQEWWAGLPGRPLSELLPRLPGISGRQADAALGRLLQMETDDPHLHDRQVQEFLRRECYCRAASQALHSPAFIALLGRLSLEAPDEARKLRKMLPEGGGRALAPVVDYLDFVLADGPELTGVTRFDSLSEEDVYLAACYWDQSLEACAEVARWDYHSVEAALLRTSGSGESGAVNSFQVWGLQPRIAEVAFRDVCRRLQGPREAGSLTDLNAGVVGHLPRPWRLASRPALPGADWRDQKGREYDVKCNLYFRSRREKEGLRGLFIRIKNRVDEKHYYPGFVFFDSDAHKCSWCYIGTYRHKGVVRGDRISPFLFRSPNSCRFEAQPADTAEHLLADWPLRLGWHLATGTTPRLPFDNRLVAEVVSRCAERPEDMPLEEALWRYLTEAALQGCSALEPACVYDLLDRMGDLICSRALPLRLPSLNGKPLLLRWIHDILRPIVDNWGGVSCPSCGRVGSESGGIQLSDIALTAEGSIDAHFTCLGCGTQRAGVRVLTHCRGCAQYPLLLGVNEVCDDCAGLVCHGKGVKGGRCLHCKRDNCPGFKRRQKKHAPAPDMTSPR
jgi:hypothetical protein